MVAILSINILIMGILVLSVLDSPWNKVDKGHIVLAIMVFIYTAGVTVFVIDQYDKLNTAKYIISLNPTQYIEIALPKAEVLEKYNTVKVWEHDKIKRYFIPMDSLK
jgi:hypothetical protein